MKLVFFGSPHEAVDGLESLIRAGHTVAAAVTRPSSPRGRSRTPLDTPVAAAAKRLGITIHTPQTARSTELRSELRQLAADLFVVVAYGRILPAEVLRIPRLGVVNVHPSLLPAYRGTSPVAAAILDGASRTGVTLMMLDEGMDTGPILAQSDPVILDGSERTGELTRRLFKIGAEMLPVTLAGLEAGTTVARPQDESLATTTSPLSKKDGDIDWARPAHRIERMVRAFDPWPGAFTTWNGRTLKVVECRALDTASGAPGTVSNPGRDELVVATGRGSIGLLSLQLEGRRAMAAGDFLRGQVGIVGATLPS